PFPICTPLPAFGTGCCVRVIATISRAGKWLLPARRVLCPFLQIEHQTRVGRAGLSSCGFESCHRLGRCSSMAEQMPSRSLYPRLYGENRCGPSGLGYLVEHVTLAHKAGVRVPSPPSHVGRRSSVFPPYRPLCPRLYKFNCLIATANPTPA